MKHQEGYQPKAPPGVDMEKVKSHPPRGGSGVGKKPSDLNDERIEALARKTAARIQEEGICLTVGSQAKIIADAIRKAVEEAVQPSAAETASIEQIAKDCALALEEVLEMWCSVDMGMGMIGLRKGTLFENGQEVIVNAIRAAVGEEKSPARAELLENLIEEEIFRKEPFGPLMRCCYCKTVQGNGHSMYCSIGLRLMGIAERDDLACEALAEIEKGKA